MVKAPGGDGRSMPLVFVSHSNQDRDIALRLVDRLRQATGGDFEIVIDDAIDSETLAIASDAYRLPYVGKRLRNAYAVISVLTRSYAESDPCWLEMSAGLMMEKVVPINLDPGLSPAGLESMVGRKDIIAIAPGWFDKEPGEVERTETAKFQRFIRELRVACARHRPFADWPPAESREVRPLTVALAAAMQPKLFRRTGLAWSPGSALAEVQQRRFFGAIDTMSIATGETVWDIARRKAVKGLADNPQSTRVRAEALMGLVGELTAPSDGSPPITRHEPWEFVGDMALPIDRDISRFAYMRAGKIPNDLRKMFQVLRPGRSKRRRIFALGAVFGAALGVVLTWALSYGGQMLFGQPGPKLATGSPTPTDATRPPPVSPSPPAATQSQPSPSQPVPTLQLPTPRPQTQQSQTTTPLTSKLETPLLPAAERARPAVPATFGVSARGLEASVRAEMERRSLDKNAWKETYSQVILLNVNSLCSPGRWQAAEAMGKKPLDLIGSDTQLTWPTETDFEKPPRLQECPVYRIPT